MDYFRLEGETAFVTGASSGLGAHFAQTLAQAGAHVVLAARRKAALEDIAARIVEMDGSCETIELDVSNHESIAAAGLSLSQCTILVNNAGIVREGAALAHSQRDWDEVIDTNLKGMFFLSQAFAQACKARSAPGAIINIASILGLRQAGGVASYAISKAGVVQLTKTLALEWARYGIRVNALAPGYIRTELNDVFWASDAGAALIKRIPQRRLGALSDLEAPLLLLASDKAGYMTGAVLEVDGGHLVGSL